MVHYIIYGSKRDISVETESSAVKGRTIDHASALACCRGDIPSVVLGRSPSFVPTGLLGTRPCCSFIDQLPMRLGPPPKPQCVNDRAWDVAADADVTRWRKAFMSSKTRALRWLSHDGRKVGMDKSVDAKRRRKEGVAIYIRQATFSGLLPGRCASYFVVSGAHDWLFET